MKDICIIPTYNERENIAALIPVLVQLAPDLYIVVVDDSSPDNTAEEVRQLMRTYPNITLLSRPRKEGLGRAYGYAFQHVLYMDGVRLVIMLDADFSHPLDSLVALRDQASSGVVAVGSRYAPEGKDLREVWRSVLSSLGNRYCQMCMHLPVHDCTGGFNAMPAELLRKIDWESIQSSGYAFQVELKYKLYAQGARFVEVPIVFGDRRKGISKFSAGDIVEGFFLPCRL